MKVTRLEIQNIRCFKNAEIDLSNRINVIVGPNNNGKTSLLNCISLLQQPRQVHPNYRRIDELADSIQIWVEELVIDNIDRGTLCFKTSSSEGSLRGFSNDAHVTNWDGAQNSEPNNLIIPYQSKRKVGGFNEGITLANLNQVNGTLSNLYAKIDRISNPEFQPAYSEYIKACDEILGFRVSTTSSDNGKKAAYTIENEKNIPIDLMGEGISNLLGLIVDLCRVKNKLFIIEEPENDIHPRALKTLLELIISKSDKNQFVVTTHSNIVLRHLGAAEGAKIFNVEMDFVNRVPTSSVHVVDSAEKRKTMLEDLGYELFDYELWDYWLFLEEASAERLIRDFFIPNFATKIEKKIRTFSARSVDQVSKKFDDFNRLFVFLHLQEIYKNKVWIVIDGGVHEKQIIDEMSSKYIASGWDANNFQQFTKHDFEEYYPMRFQDKVTVLLKETDKKKKMKLKDSLLKEVLDFIKTEERAAKLEFSESASEVISIIKGIQKRCLGK